MAVKAGVVKLAVPAAFKTMVWFGPEFTVYVTIAFGVPLNVIVAVAPEQIVAVPEIVAVGSVTIVITALPDCVCEQVGVPDDVILTKA